MTPAWQLDPRLAADSVAVVRLDISELLLMDDRRFPWLLLVPRVAGARDLVDLDGALQARLLAEVDRCSRALRTLHTPHKLNVAALGNVVEQLHVHVVARRRDDAAWPRPVWGVGERDPYSGAERDAAVGALRRVLAE